MGAANSTLIKMHDAFVARGVQKIGLVEGTMSAFIYGLQSYCANEWLYDL
jgi:hypothetical protein